MLRTRGSLVCLALAAVGLGSVLGAAGCSAREAGRGEAPPTPTPSAAPPPVVIASASPPPPPASVATASSAAASATPPAGLSPLPPRLARLGERCGSPPERGVRELCDEQGRVAAVRVMVDLVHDVPPAAAEVVRHEPRTDFTPGRELTVAVEGERLWIRHVTCGACRRILGWTLVGDLPRLSKEQLGEIQQRIGLPPEEPALRTAAAWREAYRDRPLPVSVDGGAPMPRGKPASFPGVPGMCVNLPPTAPPPPECEKLLRRP